MSEQTLDEILAAIRKAHPPRLTLDQRLAIVCPRCGQRRVQDGACGACGALKRPS